MFDIKRKLHLKLVLLFLGIASLPFILTVSQIIIELQDLQRENAIAQEKRIASFVASEISEFIASQFGVLDALDNIHFTLFPSANADLSQGILEQTLFSRASFKDMTLVNSFGKEFARSDRYTTVDPGDLVDRSESEEFISVTEGGRFISPIFWENNKPFFMIGRGFFNVYEEFQGAVFAQVDARAIEVVISQLSVTEDQGRGYVVDENGITIAHPDFSQVYLRRDFSSVPLVASLIGKHTESPSPNLYLNELDDEVIGAGEPIVISFDEHDPIEKLHTDWFVVAETPTFVAFSTVREITVFSGISLLIMVLIASITALVLAGRIVKPIESLHLATRKFRSGDLEYRVDINTGDEIEDLGDGFNQMAETLSESIITITSEKEKTLSILNSLNDGILVYNLDGNIIQTNPKTEDILVLEQDNVVGLIPAELAADPNPALRSVAAISTLLLSDFESKEMSIETPSRVHLRVTHVPLLGETKQKIGSMRILHDITEEKAVEILKSNFVSTVSHQLRTPLTGIKWGIDSLARGSVGGLPEKKKALAQRITASTESLIELVNDLLDVSRIEEGRFEYEFKVRNVEPMVKDLIKEFKEFADQKGVEISFEPSYEKLPQVLVDERKLKIAIGNIIDNAIRYTPAGGKVKVQMNLGKDSLIIVVSDTGIGISKDSKSFLFNKFYRADAAVKMHTEGSGLGLFISKQIIDRHNGKIVVDSQVDKGSQFYIHLPIQVAIAYEKRK
jgi:PAS domain S-box-containing protein